MPRSRPPQQTIRQAAVYVRMSTEHQQYSIANQSDAIEKYAAGHGLTVVKRFGDPGRSGLTLSGRPGLRQMLLDVISGRPEFTDLLIYDVSRWGRFLDVDESAFYEFTCKKEKVKVHYRCEPFVNDGSTYSTLLQAMKRIMAGEYSRGLSASISAGKMRGAQLGYRQGAKAAYGLRRAA
jgi:DNA invertase Pin-like site-specific DNA recombinase